MNNSDWEKTIKDLNDIYRDVENRTLFLPVFTTMPFSIAMWNFLKWYFWFFVDIFLIIPMNFIIFLRNIFPGRWQYRSFSGYYFKKGFVWIWSGELPFAPMVIIRPLVKQMVFNHIQDRLRLIKQYIYLDSNLSEEERGHLQIKVDALLEHWKSTSEINFFTNIILPVSVPIIEGYKYIFPDQLPTWTTGLVVLLYGCAISFVTSAFMAKRALFLGGIGKDCYFPGFIQTTKAYDVERRVFSTLGAEVTEFPFDIVLFIFTMVVNYITWDKQLMMYEVFGLHFSVDSQFQKEFAHQMIIQGGIFLLLIAICIYRRKKKIVCNPWKIASRTNLDFHI